MNKKLNEKVALHKKLSKELEEFWENYKNEPWDEEKAKEALNYKWDMIKRLNEIYDFIEKENGMREVQKES